jgi:hypothetical protein
MKKFIALSGLLILCIYAFGASIWADKELFNKSITDDDRAKGAFLPVMALYDFLVEQNAYIKSDIINMTFNERAAVPNEPSSPDGKFSIMNKDRNILPLNEKPTNKEYRLLLPTEYGDIMSTVFTPDSSMIVVAISVQPIGITCGFSTQYDTTYDIAWSKFVDTDPRLYLPAIFQVRRDVISAWVEKNELVIWGGDGERLYYYSIPILKEIYAMFTNSEAIPLLEALQQARIDKNTLTLRPGWLKIFNTFKPDIQKTLKPFMPQS